MKSSAQVKVSGYSSKGTLRVIVSCNAGVIKFTKQYAAFKTISAVEYSRVLGEIQKRLAELLPQAGKGMPFDRNYRWSGRPLQTLQERQLTRLANAG